MEAYRLVSANKGAPGIDEKSIEEFEADLKNNLMQAMEQDVIR
jgi:RNA-directed DNA polymerase